MKTTNLKLIGFPENHSYKAADGQAYRGARYAEKVLVWAYTSGPSAAGVRYEDVCEVARLVMNGHGCLEGPEVLALNGCFRYEFKIISLSENNLEGIA